MMDPLIGINAPVRLLREQWQTPTALAQELYAMFTARGPKEINDTLTIRVPAGQPALRIIQEGGDTIVNEGPTHNFGVTKNSTSTATAVPGTRPRPRPQDDGARRTPGFADDSEGRRPSPSGYGGPRERSAPSEYATAPSVSFDAPTRFTAPAVFDRAFFARPPMILDARKRVPVSLDQYVRDALARTEATFGGGDSTPAVFGDVQDNGLDNGNVGQPWVVALRTDPLTPPDFSDPNNPPQIVQVYIPYIAETEAAPVGAAIGPILQIGGKYIYQPPVWLE